MLDTVSNGTITSRTVSSAQCGSVPYGRGTAASSEPTAVSTLWCVLEAVNAVTPYPHTCSVPSAGAGYDPFGVAMREQILKDGRGQLFVTYPYDWRLRPPRTPSGLTR